MVDKLQANLIALTPYEVPTLRELGIDLVVNSPFGLAGPKGIEVMPHSQQRFKR